MEWNAYIDLVERTFWTFVAAFLGSVIADNLFDFGLDWQDNLLTAVSIGVLTAAKVVLAFALDKTSGGQLLPTKPTVEVKP
jgi:hypothetical protein